MNQKTPLRRLAEAIAIGTGAGLAMALGGYLGSKANAQGAGVFVGAVIGLVSANRIVAAQGSA